MKRMISFILCLFLVAGMIPASVSAKDVDSYNIGGNVYEIHNYEELRNYAAQGLTNVTFVLVDDIVQEDNKNDYEIVVDRQSRITLDLNGHSIKRNTRGIDEGLFVLKSDTYMCVTDSSIEKTGYCEFSTGMSDGHKAVFYNAGELVIHSGKYTIKSSYDIGICCVVYNTGFVYIYGGTFDSTDSNVGYSIKTRHEAYLYDVPKCVIYGGTFYAKYISIECYSFDNYTNYGCMFPSTYVLGGEFYIKNHNTDDAGYVYCNNGWGRVITAGGTVHKISLNNTDDRFIEGVKIKSKYVDVMGTKGLYREVVPPVMIASDDLDSVERLRNMCLKTDLATYSKTSTVYKKNEDLFEEVLNSVDYINVDGNTKTSPYVYLENYSEGDTVDWYMASTEYKGEDTEWIEIPELKNKFTQWRFGSRAEHKHSICIRAVVTYANGENFEDIIQINYEELTRVMEGKALLDTSMPSYLDTVGVYVNNAPSWQSNSTYTYEWKINGVVESTYSQFYINKASYVGKTLTCTIRSTKYKGELTTAPVVIGKAENYNQVYAINAEYCDGRITLFDVIQTQEYLFTTKSKQSLLTETDWKKAEKINAESGIFTLDYLGLSEYEGKTIYIYSRYFENDIYKAGEYYSSLSLTLVNPAKVIDMVYVTGIDEPQTGNLPDYTATVKSSVYSVAKVEWFDDTDSYGVPVSSKTRFKSGRTYRVVVTVKTKDGYTYLMDYGYNEAGGMINGKKAIVYGSHSETELEIGYKFPACPPSEEIGLLGDTTEDGIVNIVDATTIQKSIVGMTTLTETGKVLSDVDGNGVINVVDATAIQKHIVGMKTGFEIGQPV